jgi:hypothetical protein
LIFDFRWNSKNIKEFGSSLSLLLPPSLSSFLEATRQQDAVQKVDNAVGGLDVGADDTAGEEKGADRGR